MSSWVSLLVLLAACVCFGDAEGDPLPAALVELVRTSPIASIEDLQLLLFSDSVEGNSDGQSTDGQHANSSYTRLPRSLDAQPAQQAQCKVRTQVTEVTRGMLDRSNADFLLWPPCVEVQRCSGCCNTKSLHCVPVLTHTRYLQVMRIQYINKRPHYDKAVVSVSDHVECRCEPAPRSAGGSKRKHRQGHKDRAGKRDQTKEELHRQDHLKHNQRFQLDDLLKGSPWQHDTSPSLKSPLRWDAGGGGAGVGEFLPPDRVNHGKKPQTHGSHNDTASVQRGEHGESVRGHRHGDDERRWGIGHPQHHLKTPDEEPQESPEGNFTKGGEERGGERGGEERGEEGGEERGGEGHPITTQIPHTVQHRHDLSKMAAASKLAQGQSVREETNQSAVHRLSPTQRHELNQSEDDNQSHKTALANQTLGQRVRPTEVTNPSREHKDNLTQITNQWTEHRPSPTELTNHRPTGNEMPGEAKLAEERERLAEEKRELLLLHRRLDEEKERLKRRREEEEDRRLHHTTTTRTDTTAPTSTTTATATATTTTPAHHPRAPPRPPPRPHPHPHPKPPRKRKKQRNRISKAAMRAMLM